MPTRLVGSVGLAELLGEHQVERVLAATFEEKQHALGLSTVFVIFVPSATARITVVRITIVRNTPRSFVGWSLATANVRTTTVGPPGANFAREMVTSWQAFVRIIFVRITNVRITNVRITVVRNTIVRNTVVRITVVRNTIVRGTVVRNTVAAIARGA